MSSFGKSSSGSDNSYVYGHGLFSSIIKAISSTNTRTNTRSLLDQSIVRQHAVDLQLTSDHVLTLGDLQSHQSSTPKVQFSSSLLSFIDSSSFTKKQFLSLIVQITSAFLTIPQQQIDLPLQPQNILISYHHPQYYQIGGPKEHKKGMGREGDISGIDLCYLSPELLLAGDKGQSKRFQNVWSLGIILYELIYKKFPLSGNAIMGVSLPNIELFINNKEQIKYPLHAQVPEEIVKLIKKMLVANPSMRISWHQLKDMLIKSYEVQQAHFIDLNSTYLITLNSIRTFLTVVMLIRKNIDYNPNKFWVWSKVNLAIFADNLIHLTYLYLTKFKLIFSHKMSILTKQNAQNLVFIAKNIQHQERMLGEQLNVSPLQVKDIPKLEANLVSEALKIKTKLCDFKGEFWQSMKLLNTFCSQLVSYGQTKGSFFCGNGKMFVETIESFNISK